MSRPRSLTFVLPAFNEVANIGLSVLRCLDVADRIGLDCEVIVVDDGSVDGTRGIVEGIVLDDARVRLIRHLHNRGYGAALRSGLMASRKEFVFFTDADLQFDVAELRRLLAWSGRYGIVAGYRAPRRDPMKRRFYGWAWSRMVGAVFGLSVRDVDCAFKLYDRRIFDDIAIQSLGAFINTEILVRARAAGYEVKEVPVSHFPRVAGVQSGANPVVVMRAFRELGALRNELRQLPMTSRKKVSDGQSEERSTLIA